LHYKDRDGRQSFNRDLGQTDQEIRLKMLSAKKHFHRLLREDNYKNIHKEMKQMDEKTENEGEKLEEEILDDTVKDMEDYGILDKKHFVMG
jgi:hypothetical protein